MLFFAARVIREPAMQNPTLVLLTDRNDLDDQLFGQFQRCHDILGQMPVQAESREDSPLSMPEFLGQDHHMSSNENDPTCGSGGSLPASRLRRARFAKWKRAIAHGGV